ncbi:MAG TPA: F0F1 ATP synthase subunit gamma [Alloprevotella sp.]|nr:F0F1 ATP synthase subunit gamma [Alloprevotella sp.]
MASLKEVKNRIASVNSTRKITSAMKMVASSKLHRAQMNIEAMRPYESRLSNIMTTFVRALDDDFTSPYAVAREVKRVVLIVFTSNSSLCGGFNGNTIRLFKKTVEKYREQGIEIARIYSVGKKGFEAVRKVGFTNVADCSDLLDHPSYEKAAGIAREVMRLFVNGEIDKAEIIYHHFKNTASQVLTLEQFLPISMKAESESSKAGGTDNYIVEPSVPALVEKLIPRAILLSLYTAMLDSLASEHAARVIAMQVATDNADDLLRQLTLTYNKTRQQAITTELLDIVGGSMQ